ncbi:MAG: polysaccharide deacetylase family protein [Clostridia bacterium]|nr:polysaccharide deacetylase family protein [Clostridia bacterium]
MRKRIIALLLLALLFLPACGRTEVETRPLEFGSMEESLPAVTSEQREEAVLPSVESLEEDGRLFVEGKSISGGIARWNGTKMVNLREFLHAAGVEWTQDEEGYHFTLGTDEYLISTTVGGAYCNRQRITDPVFVGDVLYLSMEPLVTSSRLASLWDEEENTLYVSRVVTNDLVQKGRRVPMLMYHAVSDNTWGIDELFVKPAEMERQLKYLKDNGYTTITYEDLSRLDEIEKPVMLTFDDGYKDNYQELFPLLQKYNAKATVFMITGKLSKKRYLTPEMITEMVESGLVSVQSHTVSHPKLGEQTDARQRQELENSRLQLARLTKRVPFVLCYPSGSYNNATCSIGAEYYSFGIKMNGGLYNTSVDPFRIPRYYVSRTTSLSAFASMVG